MDDIFKFLHLHGKYPYRFLYNVKIIYMGLEYNAIVKRVLLYFFKCNAIAENKYAKVKVNLCKVKSKHG